MKRLLIALLLMPSISLAGTLELPISTDFEGLTTEVGAEFSIGPSGQAATFGGDAFSASLGVLSLYNSGFFSWMVGPEGSGSVIFESGATEVRFFATAFSGADGDFEIFVRDRDGGLIEMTSLAPGTGFQELTFSGDIGSILFDNLSSIPDSFGAVDDFSYAPAEVPEPFLAVLLGLGAGGILMRRRERRIGQHS